MASTFGSFEIAKSGMMTYNQALQVTFHNVANVGDKGIFQADGQHHIHGRKQIFHDRTGIWCYGYGYQQKP